MRDQAMWSLGSTVRMFWLVVLSAVTAGAAGARPAAAAEVRISGREVRYEAKSDEVNHVVVRPIPASGDPDGTEVEAVVISDDSAPLQAFPPCVRNGPDAVFCPIVDPVRVVVELGNLDDTLRQQPVSLSSTLRMKVSGGLGVDDITGGFFEDDIDGGAGDDILDGDDGNDILHGSAGRDTIHGGRGDDRIDGDTGDDLLLDGGGNNDTVRGGFGGDILNGGSGTDQLIAGPGKDRLESQDGEVDSLDCGTGKDTVVRDPGDSTKSCR